MIRVENLSKAFLRGGVKKEKVQAVNQVSFSIDKGKTLGLVGMSGSGKSTVGRLMLNLLSKDEGKILYDDRDISHLNFKEMKRLRKEIQILFQHPDASLNPRMTIKKSFLEPFLIHELEGKEDPMAKIEECLSFVGLNSEVLSRYPHQISGGQIQRICLGRILLLKPKFVVLDEPTSMLDVSVQAQVIEVLKKAQESFGISYLFISHDLDLIKAVSHDIGVMYQGRLIEKKKTKELYKNPENIYTQKLLNAFSEF